jgi:hypothetical protein
VAFAALYRHLIRTHGSIVAHRRWKVMQKTWISEVIELDDEATAMEMFWERGWTDGLPIVLPTESRVADFLDYAGLQPDDVVCRITDRNRAITAEKLAINGVMAGCLPEYMPVLVAATACLGTNEFKINHIASTGSLWIMMVVNGPIAKTIGLNAGMYCFGAGVRANCTIARAISLLLSNCAEARIGGIQRGLFGYSGRFNNCIAENEDVGWGPPLHVMQGYDPGTNAVSIKEVSAGRMQMRCNFTSAEGLLKTMAGAWPHIGRKDLLFIPPHFAEIFLAAGVRREDVRQYLRENIRFSVADLKRMGEWHSVGSSDLSGVMPEIKPGDEREWVYPYSGRMEDKEQLAGLGARETLAVFEPDIIPIVAGGDAGLAVLVMPGTADWPIITRPITIP